MPGRSKEELDELSRQVFRALVTLQKALGHLPNLDEQIKFMVFALANLIDRSSKTRAESWEAMKPMFMEVPGNLDETKTRLSKA